MSRTRLPHDAASRNGELFQANTHVGAWWRESFWETVRLMLCGVILALPRAGRWCRGRRPRS